MSSCSLEPFALKVGQVSEIVQAEGSYHLILLEERIPPKAIKFEDVKESLKADLMDKAVQATVKQLRQQLADQAYALCAQTQPDSNLTLPSAGAREKQCSHIAAGNQQDGPNHHHEQKK